MLFLFVGGFVLFDSVYDVLDLSVVSYSLLGTTIVMMSAA